jgi:hypothetical protein
MFLQRYGACQAGPRSLNEAAAVIILEQLDWNKLDLLST